ncbi:hypothetical protein [uncultured Methanospirillum sp.]|uniref:hypothetical protein n=1 Tax=uncultured Methanospirillum sp. TaxID=262503 RepID=UPI0029C90F18|nr:hypothetical protein [uncultured Methanospirillum sp.]
MISFIGVDLGQAADRTAISVMRTGKEKDEIIHLQRLPIGMSYPDQVRLISKIHHDVQRRGDIVYLIVDGTGVGRPIIDLIRESGIDLISVTIHGGVDVRQDGDDFFVPKRDLVYSLIVALQTEKLKIIRSLPDSEALIHELSNFKMKVNIKTGNESFEALREGIHDDLVLSCSLSCWFSSWLANLPVYETVLIDDEYDRRISSY